MTKQLKVTIDDILAARKSLEKLLKPTPLIFNEWLSERLKCEVHLKLETIQPIGSFKLRGATHKIASLSADEKKAGVIAASAGNHAQGVAWGAKKHGVKSLIVMPRNATLIKVQNTKALGAEILQEGDTYDEAYQAASRIAKETGRTFVHAYQDPYVIAGQGTVGLEILEQLPDADAVIASIGGGGLMGGIGIVMKAQKPSVVVVGAQSSGAPSMVESAKQGRAIKLDGVHTFADGIAVRAATEPMFHLLKENVDRFVEVGEEDIAGSVLELIEKAKVVSEGAGAVPLAALTQHAKDFKGKKVVLVVSGGNIDVNLLGRILERGLTKAGRRLRMNVLIPDTPGSLAKISSIIGEQGGSIIQAFHDRGDPFTKIDETEVVLTVETKGHDHSNRILEAVRAASVRVEIQA